MRNMAVLLLSLECWGVALTHRQAEEDGKFEPRGSLYHPKRRHALLPGG